VSKSVKTATCTELENAFYSALPTREVALVLIVSIERDPPGFTAEDMADFQSTIEQAQGYGHVRLARVENVPSALDITP
jgi:hypothetical protein